MEIVMFYEQWYCWLYIRYYILLWEVIYWYNKQLIIIISNDLTRFYQGLAWAVGRGHEGFFQKSVPRKTVLSPFHFRWKAASSCFWMEVIRSGKISSRSYNFHEHACTYLLSIYLLCKCINNRCSGEQTINHNESIDDRTMVRKERKLLVVYPNTTIFSRTNANVWKRLIGIVTIWGNLDTVFISTGQPAVWTLLHFCYAIEWSWILRCHRRSLTKTYSPSLNLDLTLTLTPLLTLTLSRTQSLTLS